MSKKYVVSSKQLEDLLSLTSELLQVNSNDYPKSKIIAKDIYNEILAIINISNEIDEKKSKEFWEMAKKASQSMHLVLEGKAPINND